MRSICILFKLKIYIWNLIHCRDDGYFRDFSFDRAILKNSFVSRRGKHPVTIDVLLVAHYRAKVCHPVSNGCSLRIRKDFIDLQIECHISRSWFEHTKRPIELRSWITHICSLFDRACTNRGRSLNFNPGGLVSNTSGHFDSNLAHRVLSSKRITFPFPTIDTIASFQQISST